MLNRDSERSILHLRRKQDVTRHTSLVSICWREHAIRISLDKTVAKWYIM
jgi:hypothetical protein